MSSTVRDTTDHHPHCMCRACYWQRRAERAEAQRDALLKRPPTSRAADQIRTIRTLQLMWAMLGTHGMPGEREVFALVAADLGKVLDQPGEPTINPQLNVAQPVDQTKDT